jgi:hypothetical protein
MCRSRYTYKKEISLSIVYLSKHDYNQGLCGGRGGSGKRTMGGNAEIHCVSVEGGTRQPLKAIEHRRKEDRKKRGKMRG